jgi:hypothetical protein
MRIRSTKPEFWRSKTIARLDWSTRLVLKGLESYVDDNGVGKDDLALIAADVFPRDLSSNPRDTLARLSEAISTLAEGGLIARYKHEAENLLYIDRWKDLQRIDKPGKGRFPRPDGTLEYAEPVNRESYGKPRESVANVPEVVAPGTGEQGSSGTEEQISGSASLVTHQGGDEVAPPKKCRRHIDDPHPPSCGACAQARRDSDDWESNAEARRRDAQRAKAAERQRAADDATRAILACSLCDEDGYIGTRVCDHIDHTTNAKAGIAAVRQALAKGSQ